MSQGRVNLVRSSSQIAFVSLLSGLFSFVNQAVLARFFGSGPKMSAYVVGTSAPLLGAGLVGALVTYSIIPVLIHHGQDPIERKALEGRLFWLLASLCLGVATVGIVSAQYVIRWIAPSLQEPSVAFASAIFAWFSFVTITLTSYNAAVWNARGVYLRPAIASLCPTLGALLGATLFGAKQGPAAVAAGILVGSGFGFSLLAFGATFRLVPSEAAKAQSVSVLQRTPLVLCSIAVFSIYGTSDSYFASRLGEEAVGYLAYSQRIVIGLGALVTAAPLMLMLPILSQLSVDGNEAEFRRMSGRALKMVVALSAGIGLVLAELRVPALSVLLQRGKFTLTDTATMSTVFVWIAVGMVPMLATSVAFQALYAKRDWTTAAKIGIAGSLGYLGMSASFSRIFGLPGFGAAYLLNWSLVLLAAIGGIWGFRGLAQRVAGQASFAGEVAPGLLAAWIFCRGAEALPVGESKLGAAAQLAVGIIAFGLYLLVSKLVSPNGTVASLLNGLSSKLRPSAVAP